MNIILTKFKLNFRGLMLVFAIGLVAVFGYIWKTNTTHAQACSGCRNASLVVNAMPNGADTFTTVSGTFAGGYYKSGTVCYPRQFKAGSMTYRVLNTLGTQVYPASGYAALPDAMNQVHSGSNYDAGATPCTGVTTNMYTYEFTSSVPLSKVAAGTYYIEIEASSIYSGNTSTAFQDTSVNVVPAATSVDHSGYTGQLILSGMMGTYGDTTITQNDTAAWNLTLSCTNYNGKVNLDVTQPFTGVTLQWYSGNTLVGTGSTFYNRTCGEALTLKMVTGASTAPLSSAQPIQVCLSSPGNVAMASCSGQPNFTILGQPKITSFTASSKAVVPGGSTNLSWTTQNVTSATTGCAQSVTSGSATGWTSNTAPSSGSNVSVTINSVPTVLTLTCASPNGTTAASASITITSLGDFNFNTAPTAFTNVGGSISQTFTVNCTAPFAGPLTNVNMQSTLSGVTSYRITDLTSGLASALNSALATANCSDVLQLDLVLSANVLPISWGSYVTPVTVNLIGTAASVGTKIGGGFNLTIYANPQVTLAPTAVAGPVGSSPTLNWTSTFASSCTATNGSSGWSGNKATSGSQTLSAINTATTYTYTLTCYNYVYPTAVNTSYTTSSAKIQVELKYDSTLYSYPTPGAPQRSVYYYIIDRTNGNVILPQAMYYQPQEITTVIPGHQYQLMYNSGWLGTADYGGSAALYKKASPFITNTSGADLSAAQTIADGQTLVFRLNWQNVGNVSSPFGQGCQSYYYTSNRNANMDLWSRLYTNNNNPSPVTTNGQLTGSGQLTADEPTYYTPSPSSNFFTSAFVSVDWKPAAVNLRESPGWYYYWMVSSTMSGYCSTVSIRLQVDAPATPTYGFTAAPVSLSFSAQQNGAVPAAKDVNITGTGNTYTPVNASGAASWLTVNPTSMTLNSYTQYMHFQPNTTNLPIGTYNSLVRIMDTQGNYYDVTISYTINANSASCPNGPQVQLSSRYVNVGGTVTASAPTPGVALLGANYGTVDSYAGYTALADLNGDGWLDMIVANNNVGSISVFLNQGDGTYGPHTEYTIGLFTGVIRVADFNGDGKPDLAVSNTDSSYYSRTSILINNGSGAFGVQTDYYSLPTNVFFPGGIKANQQGLVVADFNGDGKADIMYASNPLVSNSNQVDGSIRTLVVRLGNGNGTFGAEQITTTNLSAQDTVSSYAVLADDFNADGKKDVVLINNSSAKFWVFNGLGTGKFGTGAVYSTGNSIDIASADLNNDGKPDLVTADMGYSSGGSSQANGTTATVYLNNGNGTFTNSGSYTTASQPRSVALGDINGDGKVDIAVLNNYNTSNNVTVLLGDGLGGFGYASSFSNLPAWSGQNITLGDIDNDGKLDIITTNAGSVEYFKNISSVPPIPFGASYSGGTYTVSNSVLASIAGTTITALDGRPNSGIVYVSATGLTYNTGSYFASGCTLNPTPLYIRDFNIYSTGNQSVLQGVTANLGFNVVAINNFSGSVALSNSGAPSIPGPVTMSPTGPFNSFPNTTTVTVPTSASTAGGDYTVRGIGTYNGVTRVGNANLNVTTPQVADIKVSKDGTNGSYVDGPLTIGYNVAPFISWTTSGVSTCSVTGPGLNSSALSNTGVQVSNLTANQTYTISCDGGTVTDTVSVVVYNNVPTMQSVTNATDGTTPCGQVKITWSANGAASSYKVYRNINNSTSDGGLVSVITGITNTYYLYTNPPAGPYYYFVTAVDSNGNESNYTATSNNKGAALSCTVDLSTSDIEISSVNGTANNNPSAADCDRSTAPIATAPGLLRKGNKIVFKVNVCNSGGIDFVPSVGSPLQITSTLANLTFSSTDPITYNCGGCTGSYQITPGSGTSPDTVVFTINNGTLPKQSSSNPSVWSITFTASTRSPSTSNASIFRFNNRADITAGAYHNSYSTPYYFFYFNQANPVIKEVGH